MGSGELTPDKPRKRGVRWSESFGMSDEGTVVEAGTPDPSGRKGCQKSDIAVLYAAKK